MKKHISWTSVCCILLLLILLSCSKNGGNYGKAKWGMNTNQVKRMEQSKFIGYRPIGINKTSLMFADDFAGFNTYITYRFTNNGLEQVRLTPRPDSGNGLGDAHDFIQGYNKIKKLLVDEYGESEVIKGDTDIWCHSRWKTSASQIDLMVKQGEIGDDTFLSLVFSSKKLINASKADNLN